MAPSDDFKAQLKAGNINEALSLALNGAVDLKITTWVTTGDQQTFSQPGHRLRTRINTIEGKVDNEIGDQFIGNGPYRELRQFHLEQVTQGREIIKSNLKSLQTLFEVVIAMQSAQRRIASLPSFPGSFVLEPSSDEQLLPAAPVDTDATLLTEPSAVVEELASAPDSPAEDVEELASVPDSLAEVSTPLPQIEVPATVPGVPATTPPEALIDEDEDEDDDWDDSVLDLLESLPVGPLEPDALDDSEEEDWRNFIEEDDAPDPELDSPITEDWGILTAADFEPATETNLEPPNLPEDLGELIKEEPSLINNEVTTQEWEKLSFEDLQSPTETPVVIPETLIPEEEDWGDLIEEEAPAPSNKPVPSLESLDLEDEEWDDWVVESEPLQDSSMSRLESLDVADDDDWDDFEEEEETDSFAPALTNSALSEDADWDNFSVDELEPYSGLLDLDTNVGAGFDLSGTFEDFSVANEDNEYLERPQQQVSKPSAKDANDLMEVLFGDDPQHQKTDKTEEELFADMQFEEFLANGGRVSEESEPPVFKIEAEADLEAPPASPDKILPPPPPPAPSQLPNQNNQTRREVDDD